MAAVATFQRALANVRKRTQDGLGVKQISDLGLLNVEMMLGRVYRPSRLLVPYELHMRRCSSTTSHPFIVHTTPHTCHDTAARQGTSGTVDTGTTSRARTQTGSRADENTQPSDT